MLFNQDIDIVEQEIEEYEKTLLDILLFDRSTRENILWATDNYESYGPGFGASQKIVPELIIGEYSTVIQPRVSKSKAEQIHRTRDKAEVFTPSWVCNEQNNSCDARWFGRENVFNTPKEHTWVTNPEKITFPDESQKSWKKYVDSKRLEMSCGEAPYLVSRYDATSGERLSIENRIGILDRKLRVVGENTESREDWIKWAIRAFQATYGYDWQGDNVLLARENLLLSFIEYYTERFENTPKKELLIQIARIISWNVWQMDGIKFVVPNSCKPVVKEDITLFGIVKTECCCPGCKTGDIKAHTGVYCKVFDWREKASVPFVSLLKGDSRL